MKRFLAEDPYIHAHRTAICTNHLLGGDIFELVLSRIILRNDEIHFLQIGANSGIGQHDIFDHIKRFKIKSILVEPQPDVYAQLKRHYSDIPNARC